MQQYKKIMSVAWMAALVLAISCSSNNDDEGTAVAIGPRGGLVSGPDGVSLDIPKGALDEEVSFSIHRRSTAPAAGGGVVPAGNVYEFLPHGVAFKKDVVVTVPFDESKVADAAAALALFWANQEEGPYAALAGTQVDGFKRQVSGFTRHLSYGVAGLPEESKPLDTEPSDTGDTTDTDDTDGTDDTDTGTDDTDDTDTGTDDTDDTDTGTDDPVAAACDLSGWSLEQIMPFGEPELPICFTFPQGLVLQPGFSLVVTTFSGEQGPSAFFDNFDARKGLHEATWTLQESQIEKDDSWFVRDDFWFVSDAGVHYIDLARIDIYNEAEDLLISFSDWPIPDTRWMQSISLRNGSCLDITGAETLGGENTQGSGELIDGPIEMFELTDNGTNMTRQVFSGYGETIAEWTIENIPMIASWVATPGAGAVPSGGRALITEIGSLRPDGEYGIPEFIEITCPGGKVADFCSAMNDQDCNDGEPLQSCARRLPLPHLIPDEAMQCVMDMVDCDEQEECWTLALEEEEPGVTP